MDKNIAFIRRVFVDGSFSDQKFILKNDNHDFTNDDWCDPEEDRMYDDFYALEDDRSGKYKYAFLVYGQDGVSLAIVFGKYENFLINTGEMVTVGADYIGDIFVGPYCGNMIAINSVDINTGICMVSVNSDSGRKNMPISISCLEPFGDGIDFPVYSSNLLDSFLEK